MPYHSVHRHHHHHHIVRIGSGHIFTCRAGQTYQLSRQFNTVLCPNSILTPKGEYSSPFIMWQSKWKMCHSPSSSGQCLYGKHTYEWVRLMSSLRQLSWGPGNTYGKAAHCTSAFICGQIYELQCLLNVFIGPKKAMLLNQYKKERYRGKCCAALSHDNRLKYNSDDICIFLIVLPILEEEKNQVSSTHSDWVHVRPVFCW